ncbi:MAG TPA: acyltransferase domain-containing protein, partial [Kofleriaceae bacterium]|nr:acyltransferase domain-containing protein [Kofleriaceae bacterium]
VAPKTLHVDAPTRHVDWATGAVAVLDEARAWPAVTRPRRSAVSSFGISGTNAHVILEAPAREQVAYLFTGQGSQRVGMGRGLYERYPVFAQAFDAVCAALDGKLGRSLQAIVFGGEGGDGAEGGLLDQTLYTQSSLFALEVSLYRLLEARGFVPDAVLGHSIGEVAAAHVAGVLTLDDACTLVAARASLMQALPTGGAMIAIEATEDEVAAQIAQAGPGVAIAAVNGARSVVVSGDEAPALAVASALEASGRRTKRLRVSHAFHSPRMAPMLDDFRAAIGGLTFSPATIRIESTVAAGADLADPEYWVRQVREAVRFADGMNRLAASGVTQYVELGPDGVLAGMADEVTVVPTLRKGHDEAETFERAVRAIDPTAPLPEVALPFDRKRYWLAGASSAMPAGEHPLLGPALWLAEGDRAVWSGRWSLGEQAWLADHAVAGTPVIPGALWLELALFAGRATGTPTVRELTLHEPMVLGEAARTVQVAVGAAEADGTRSIGIHSRGGDGEAWRHHASGVLGGDEEATSPDLAAGVEARDNGAIDDRRGRHHLAASHAPTGEATAQSGTNDRSPAMHPPGGSAVTGAEADPTLAAAGLGRGPAVTGAEVYPTLAAAGLGYGPAFRGLQTAWRDGETIIADVRLPDSVDGEGHVLHPALLDAALHALVIAGGADGAARVPYAWSQVRLHAAGATAVRATLT